VTGKPSDSPRPRNIESEMESNDQSNAESKSGSKTESNPEFVARQASAEENRRMLRWIMWTVFVWGCLLSLGAALHGVDPETAAVTWSPKPLRGLVVFTAVSGLLLGWNLLLRQRKDRF
jgi:hypothetical protein